MTPIFFRSHAPVEMNKLFKIIVTMEGEWGRGRK